MATSSAARPSVVIDPDAGIPDLLRRLVDDSKRLAQDEVQLARLEVRERAHDAARGGIWLGVAFGAGVIALIAFTVFLAALIGRALNFHYWAGTLIVAVLELAVGAWLVVRGLGTLKKQSFTMPETRKEAAVTARWAKTTGAAVAEDVREARRALTSAPAAAAAVAGTTGGHVEATRKGVEIPITRRT